MRFVYGAQDWTTRERGQENCYLLTNGLGGFSSGTIIGSNVTRCASSNTVNLSALKGAESPYI